MNDRRAGALALALPGLALAAGLAPRLATWWRRAYAHDDFMILTWAWLRSVGRRPGVDTTLSLYTPLAEVLAPVFRSFPDSFVPIEVARAFVLMAVLSILVSTYLIARRLGSSPPFALAAVNLASWQSDFVRRAGDVRNDPFAAAALLASIALLTGGAAPSVAGLVYGVSGLFSIKYALAFPFLVLGVLFARRQERPLAQVARFTAGAAIAPLLFVACRLAIDGAAFLAPWKLYLGTGRVRAGSNYFIRSLADSPITFALVALGLVGWLAAARRGEKPPATYGGLVLAFLVLFAITNPFFFPYNFVLLTPLLAPIVCGLESLARGRRLAWSAALLAAVVLPVLEGRSALVDGLSRTNERQRAVLSWLWSATTPQERVFDNNGMHLFRPGVYHWYTYAGELPAYLAGRSFSFEDELRKTPVTLAIQNDRLAWLNARDRAFFRSHFVPLAGDHCILVPADRAPARPLPAPGPCPVPGPLFYDFE